RREENDIILIFTVSDSGIGIQSEYMPNLFKDFSRVHDESAYVIEGTGLGLPITRQLCRAMGGDVEAQSEYRAGSIFKATIRQGAPDNTPMGFLKDRTTRRHSGIVKFHAPDFRVLIVDDNAANLKVAAGLLAPYKIKTEACHNGKEALKAVQAREYDLVFMDNMMPEMDGIQALAAIRALGGPFEKLPIVAFTANAMIGMKEYFLEKGFDDYLTKPIETKKLNALIERWVPPDARRGPENGVDSGDARSAASVFATDAMPDISKAELAAQRLDLLNHYRWHFVNRMPAGSCYYNKFSELVEIMEVAPELREDMAALAAAGRRGDGEEIRWLLPGLYNSLAASMLGKDAEDDASRTQMELEDALARLKNALDAGDEKGVDAVMDELRKKNSLCAEARELYCLINDALLMGETEKALAHIAAYEARSAT
ncbi:MAG: response regulator, partial [Syntrophorhabdaceae bacterium]|nr:response regulator [Syntrophorhabdaceae bacterium]